MHRDGAGAPRQGRNDSWEGWAQCDANGHIGNDRA